MRARLTGRRVKGVDYLGAHLVALQDRDLHHAQKRPVATLADELGVDAEPPRGAGLRGELGDGGGGEEARWNARHPSDLSRKFRPSFPSGWAWLTTHAG